MSSFEKTLLLSSFCFVCIFGSTNAKTTDLNNSSTFPRPGALGRVGVLSEGLSEQSRARSEAMLGAMSNAEFDAAADFKTRTQKTLNALPSTVSPSVMPLSLVTESATFNGALGQERDKVKETLKVVEFGHNLMDRVKAQLPRIISEVKFGPHITVSKNGEQIIDQIRALATQTGKSRVELLNSISESARLGTPEAQNFIGLAYEIGLFGVSRNIERATAFYKAAASKEYPPAVFNLGLVMFYAKGGVGSDQNARTLLTRSAQMAKGIDKFRTCGMASFVNYQFKKMDLALENSIDCDSPLANLAKVGSLSMTTPDKIRALRFFSETGANEGFALLEKVSKDSNVKDDNYPYCTWHIFNTYLGRVSVSSKNIRTDATQCIATYLRGDREDPVIKMSASLAVTSVIASVNAEVLNLKKLRALNRVHYSWPVPYLPFNTVESDVFYPLMSATIKSSNAINAQLEVLN